MSQIIYSARIFTGRTIVSAKSLAIAILADSPVALNIVRMLIAQSNAKSVKNPF
jgi:hypothetical protein